MKNAVDFPEIIQKSSYFKSFFWLCLSKPNYFAFTFPSFKFHHMKDQFKWFHFFRFYIPTTFNEICTFVWCFKHRVWIKAINVKKNYIWLLNNVPKHFSQIKYGVVLTNKINASNSRHFSNEPSSFYHHNIFERKKKKLCTYTRAVWWKNGCVKYWTTLILNVALVFDIGCGTILMNPDSIHRITTYLYNVFKK